MAFGFPEISNPVDAMWDDETVRQPKEPEERRCDHCFVLIEKCADCGADILRVTHEHDGSEARLNAKVMNVAVWADGNPGGWTFREAHAVHRCLPPTPGGR